MTLPDAGANDGALTVDAMLAAISAERESVFKLSVMLAEEKARSARLQAQVDAAVAGLNKIYTVPDRLVIDVIERTLADIAHLKGDGE